MEYACRLARTARRLLRLLGCLMCFAFIPVLLLLRESLSIGAGLGPEHLDRRGRSHAPRQKLQAVAECSPCCHEGLSAPGPSPAAFCVPSAQSLFPAWNPTHVSRADPTGSGMFRLLTSLKLLSPGDHLVLLSCQAGKHPYARGRLGAGNSDKLLLNKVLLMAQSLLCQNSTKILL